MRTIASADVGDSLPIEELRDVLREYPVRLGILFGSHATGRARRTSDVDVAVEFESIDHDDPEYNEIFFGLSADLSETLATDDVDLLDVRALSPALAEAMFEDGVLLVGDPTHAESRLRRIASQRSDERTPRERFDTALRKIDEHLGGDAAVSATDGSREER